MRTAVFDLDGTLADTSADLIAAANVAVTELGFGPQLDPGRDAETAFAGGRAMLRLSLQRLGVDDPHDLVEKGYPVLLDAYAGALDVHTRLYPGARAALDRLSASGWIMGVCTNKPVAMANDLLERLGVADHFRAVLGADSLSVRKPDPLHLRQTVADAGGAIDRSVLIGDTINDRETARNADVPCILVTFGPTGERVRDLQPEGLLAHYDHLDMILDDVLPLSRD